MTQYPSFLAFLSTWSKGSFQTCSTKKFYSTWSRVTVQAITPFSQLNLQGKVPYCIMRCPDRAFIPYIDPSVDTVQSIYHTLRLYKFPDKEFTEKEECVLVLDKQCGAWNKQSNLDIYTWPLYKLIYLQERLVWLQQSFLKCIVNISKQRQNYGLVDLLPSNVR